MTYVPHFPCTIRWSIPHTVFTAEAAEKQVGQTMMFCGNEVVVKKAWVEAGDMMMTLDQVSFFRRLDEVQEIVDEANEEICEHTKSAVSKCICMEHDPDGSHFRASLGPVEE